MSAPSGRRRSGLVRVFLCLGLWAGAAGGALWFAAETNHGRVMFTLSRNHGIHVGDLLATMAAGAGALVGSVVLLRPLRRSVRGAEVPPPAKDLVGSRR